MTHTKTNFTAIIADDHVIVRNGLKMALQQADLLGIEAIEIISEAANGLEALTEVKEKQPDVIFLDISMPLASGPEIIADLRRWSPHTKIIIFSAVTSSGLLSSLVEAGVDGIFSKGADMAALYEKLPLILRGGRFIAPEILAHIKGGENLSELTVREKQALHMILAGKTTKEIAALMGISAKTADKHRTSLMGKLKVHSLAELMAKALKEGLIGSHENSI
ncbi:MAG: response regulator transcription factor [bacterium]